MTNITLPRFTDADAAREHLEALRWPQGPYCPHCGSFTAKRLPEQRGRPSKAHPEGAIRKGVIQCNDCRKQYSVTVGTVFEDSKVPLNKWLLANHLIVSSKKGISAHQLHRMLGVTYKTAWFMAHRIREAMIDTDDTPMGGDGGMVEVDETYVGRVPGESRMAIHNKNKVFSLVERNTGRATSIVFTGHFSAASIAPILAKHVAPEARLMTDGAQMYKTAGKAFASHDYVDHAKGEYVRKGDSSISTNQIEGFFGIFKRGMRGIYQHCGSQHLQRYLREFDFRYTNRVAVGVNDEQRADLALKGITGKRLTYRRVGSVAA
ncbi:MAG: IS1595 family transposase [Sphingomonadales bacterium]|nr:MAG: IS1595 family transposase [Sphingomonadales bacterium]